MIGGIFHFHKAPGERSRAWADIIDEEEEQHLGSRSPHKTCLRSPPVRPSPFPLRLDASEDKDFFLNTSIDLSLDAAINGDSEDKDFAASSSAEHAPREGAEQEGSLDVKGSEQEGSLEESLKPACDTLKFDLSELQEPLPAQNIQKSEPLEEKLELPLSICHDWIKFLELAGITTPIQGLYDENHKLCVSCTQYIQEHISKSHSSRAKADTTQEQRGAGRRSPKTTRAASVKRKDETNSVAVQQLRLADILPPPPQGRARRRRAKSKKASQFSHHYVPLFMCYPQP